MNKLLSFLFLINFLSVLSMQQPEQFHLHDYNKYPNGDLHLIIRRNADNALIHIYRKKNQFTGRLQVLSDHGSQDKSRELLKEEIDFYYIRFSDQVRNTEPIINVEINTSSTICNILG